LKLTQSRLRVGRYTFNLNDASLQTLQYKHLTPPVYTSKLTPYHAAFPSTNLFTRKNRRTSHRTVFPWRNTLFPKVRRVAILKPTVDWVRSTSSITGFFIMTRWRDPTRRFLWQRLRQFPATSSLLLHKLSKTGTFLDTLLRIHVLGNRNRWVPPGDRLRGRARRCGRHKCPYSSQLFIRFVELLQ
jgi:hypothetical protein